ncbi:MAG: hypothetical protein AUJ58_11400 [Zetaproteobacteria bacterium CG1_02_55_237]|nr:MAG: hypothetical protein AUJ58_11400 [Zetaproteobacteria bacterium CG1_02_55_237]
MPLHRHLLYCSLLLGLAGCSMFNWNKGEQTAEEQAVVSSIATEPVEQAPSELQLVWGVDVDQRRPLSPYSFAQPVQAGDLIVLTGQDSYAHIYNMQGSEVHRVALHADGDSGGLAMSADLVVLSDAQGILYGIDPREGSILWEWKMSTAMFGHPVRIGDDLLVQTGDNSVYRISDKGEKLWSFSGPQAGLSMNSGPSPLVDGDVCYTVMTNGDALALRSDNGDLLWRRQLMLDNDAVVLSELKTPLADPVLIGDVLVVSFYQGDLIGLSARDGQQLWQRSLSLKSAPLAHDGRLFAASNDSVLELDPASGATLWKRKLDAGELVGPALAQAKLYVADIRGNVFTLSLDGHVTGELHLPGRVDRSPVVVAGGVLLRNNLGGLYLIR